MTLVYLIGDNIYVSVCLSSVPPHSRLDRIVRRVTTYALRRGRPQGPQDQLCPRSLEANTRPTTIPMLVRNTFRFLTFLV